MKRNMGKVGLFLSTFLLVFAAELGDKTQIAAFSLAANEGKIWSVAIGSVLGFIGATAFAVLAGHLIAAYLPEKVLKRVSGVLFLAAGVFLLARQLISG